jgi:tRNA dimethylallyltransferase
VVAGPTAVGKTDLAIKLAEYFNTEIISSDARQFYREMEIGTAKPSKEQIDRVQHHFIDHKSVSELYGAGDFANDCLKLLNTLFAKKDVLILVGGSGLYIDAVLKGMDEFEKVPVAIRERLNAQYLEKGLSWLGGQLLLKDPEYYQQVDDQNPQRIIRALEVIEHTGEKFSTFLKRVPAKRDFTAIKLLINLPRPELYRRIEDRVDQMMSKGLLKEVMDLQKFWSYNALKTVGYKELVEHIEGATDLITAVNKIKQHTRNYAKRQLTWFRNRDNFKEFEPRQTEEIIRYINQQMQ